jgi:arsenate reductase
MSTPADPPTPPKDIRMTTIPEVLFVCVHNQGRSQMAAGLLTKHANGRVHVRSAGSEPADNVNPVVVEVMNEVGVDISRELPRKLLTEDVAASDVVITMGCGDACPIFPGKRYEDWALVDPSGKDIDAVRAIRDDIDERVRTLLAQLTATHA